MNVVSAVIVGLWDDDSWSVDVEVGACELHTSYWCLAWHC